MASVIPVTLAGKNLGERHRYFNNQVNEAATQQVLFDNIESLPEQTPIDRLFKIDLANKLKNVDYILKNIKDDDMLYVSRALKSKWLLKHHDIINPKYLEDVLFPEMVMCAISKMKHWLYINLNDPIMCQQFYQHYKDKNFEFAIKFLRKCDNEFLMNEFPNILIKITPHYLKVLGEKCPILVKTYYDSLATDKELVKQYVKNEEGYYKNIRWLLKSDPDLFLDITEKYHRLTFFSVLSPSATEYILHHRKNRVLAKTELYVTYILHIPTVAQNLSVEECQEVVIKLARAKYVSWWFSYHSVEPLVKRVNRTDKGAFKKKVFVEKDVGELVEEWPYPKPIAPDADTTEDTTEEIDVFKDQEYEPIQMMRHIGIGKRKLMKRSGKCKAECMMASNCYAICPIKSELQKLFDEFRFKGFDSTLHELKGRINATSLADRRRDMLLVLVSKSGGRADSVRVLLQLALKLRNEPVHQRATVVRSLTKRANAWRLPQDVWDAMLEYGQGLGLDGTEPQAECREGLHAVVLRQLLATGDCQSSVLNNYLNEFSTLAEYKLTVKERESVTAGLQRILIATAADAEPEVAARRLSQLLEVLKSYRIKVGSAPVLAISALADRDMEAAMPLLEELYGLRVGRRQFLRQYLKFRHDDAALVNALRHDPNVINPDWLIELLVDGKTRARQYFSKLSVYFDEKGGNAQQVRQTLQNVIAQKPDAKLARPLATLSGKDLQTIWREQDKAGVEHHKLAAALRANMHHARPAPDALALDWRKAGMKAVSWRVMRCRPSQTTQLVQTLLKKQDKRSVRMALILAQRTDNVADAFAAAAAIRPYAVLRAAMPYFKRQGNAADLQIWSIVKPFVSSVNLETRPGLRDVLKNVEWVPKAILSEYCAMLYLNCNNIPNKLSHQVLLTLMDSLTDVNDDLLENIILQMLNNIDKESPQSYPAIIIRYLMLSKDQSDFKSRFDKVGEPFLKKIYTYNDKTDSFKKAFFDENLEQIMSSLQYYSVFFNTKYQCPLLVIERVLSWIQEFLPKETHFREYVKIHATMLFYKAVRQSIKQHPEIFNDSAKKASYGVDIVGYTFGRYIAKEMVELITKYFESIIGLYCSAFTEYLNYFTYSNSKSKFTAAITKGILSESVGSEARLALYIRRDNQYNWKESVNKEIDELITKYDNIEIQFFANTEF